MTEAATQMPPGMIPGWAPVPDPTKLTTEALTREIDRVSAQLASEIAGLKELLEGRIGASTDIINARLSGMDEAIKLLQAINDRNPAQVDGKIAQAVQLINERFATTEMRFALQDEKFDSVQTQFRERDTRGERESRDNKVAVDAAFAAQKEAASEQNKSNTLAIDKSERATAETLNKQADLFKATTDGQGRELAEVKERLTRIESERHGRQETVGTVQGARDNTLAYGLAALGVVSFIASIVLHFVK